MIQFDEHIFQRGWNHKLVVDVFRQYISWRTWRYVKIYKSSINVFEHVFAIGHGFHKTLTLLNQPVTQFFQELSDVLKTREVKAKQEAEDETGTTGIL